jgi:hypothetical protein
LSGNATFLRPWKHDQSSFSLIRSHRRPAAHSFASKILTGGWKFPQCGRAIAAMHKADLLFGERLAVFEDGYCETQPE